MACIIPLQSCSSILSNKCSSTSARSFSARIIPAPVGFKTPLLQRKSVSQVQQRKRSSLTVVAAVGDVSAEGTNYLIAGAVAVALLGTGFPILFSRKDLYQNLSLSSLLISENLLYELGLMVAVWGILVCVWPGGGYRCPECDGAGFVRKSAGSLRANAASKDQVQIVCARCDGLGKLNQIDK